MRFLGDRDQGIRLRCNYSSNYNYSFSVVSAGASCFCEEMGKWRVVVVCEFFGVFFVWFGLLFGLFVGFLLLLFFEFFFNDLSMHSMRTCFQFIFS